MKSVVWALCLVAMLAMPAAGADFSIVPVGPATIAPGQTVRVEVFLAGITLPERLRLYQARLQIVPQAGSFGTLTLEDPTTPDPGNLSIFVDQTRANWVFAPVAGPVFGAATPDLLRIGATILNPSESVEVVSPAYCGTFVFIASADAVGTFSVDFLLVDPTNPGNDQTVLRTDTDLAIAFTTSSLLVTVADIVVNDDCIDAIPAGDGVTAFTTANATAVGPDLTVACDEGNGVAINQDVWYEHIASCTGTLAVSTCNDATFNTRLAVYGGGAATCTCPTGNTNLLACNDDNTACTIGTSIVSLPVTAGGCYSIRVGGVGLAEGTGNLNITCLPDLCADALRIAPASTVRGQTTNTAVNDNVGPDCGSGPVGAPGVWYSVLGTGNVMRASLRFDASFDSRLTVYQGGCGALTCVGDNDRIGNGGEAVSWCSVAGVEYRILVHGAGGASGTFTLDTSDTSCNDNNACTNDSCNAGTCSNVANFDTTTSCCAPSTGGLAVIDDGNACTNDTCNSGTGVVSHTSVPNGLNAACEDFNPCTRDICQAGSCAQIDINGLSCLIDADCDGDSICGVSGLCECVGATLQLVASPSTLPVAGCFGLGDVITVRVELGPQEATTVAADAIIGAQFFLAYNPASLAIISVLPGSNVDPTSPFSVELQEVVDPGLGLLDYLVTVPFGNAGTRAPGTLAVITFQAVAECSGDLRFRAGPNAAESLLTTVGGGEVVPILVTPSPILVDATGPTLSSCFANVVTSPDSGLLTAIVTWPDLVATDTCDPGSRTAICSPPSGTAFTPGTTTVTCAVTDSCGLQDTCIFDVTVIPQQVTMNVELGPTMNAGPFDRCVTFEVWDCAAPGGPLSATVDQTLTFSSGMASNVTVQIPGGNWGCLMAQDTEHTLRSTATDFSTLDGFQYTASFTGTRSAGGHWLVGGDLNGDGLVDIRDFGVFFPFFLTQANNQRTCSLGSPDANINGDGVVDLLDLVFLSGNSLLSSEPACCGLAIAATDQAEPLMSITVRELHAMGLGHMAAADVNHDGVLDQQDMIALIDGSATVDDASVVRESVIKQRGAKGRHGQK